MTRTISFITAVAATILVAAPAAWAQPVPDVVERAVAQSARGGAAPADFWNYEAGTKVANISPGLTPTSLARLYATDSRMPANAIDARERAFGTKREVQLRTVGTPDAFERAVGNRPLNDYFRASDNRYQLDRASQPVARSVTGSAGGSGSIDWPEIGIGFGMGLGVGIVLLLGVALAARARRQSPIAH